MQRMSGIATLTRQYSNKIKGGIRRVLDTRKTTPVSAYWKKPYASAAASNHRMGPLRYDHAKDNHIDYSGGLEQAIERAHRYVTEVKAGLKN